MPKTPNPDDRLGEANFAEGGDRDVRNRLTRRLSQERRPTTQTSSGSWINWNYASEVLGQPFDVQRIPISKLEQMRRDPMLAFGLTFVKVPLIRAPWLIKSSDPQRAAFIDNALRKIYARFIMAYTNAFDFGFSPMIKRFELTRPQWQYMDKESGQEKDVWDKGVDALTWKPFLALSPRGATPHWNSKGEFSGIDFAPSGGVGAFGMSGFSPSSSASGKVADIPLDWALWATNEKDSVFGSLWGYPRIGYAYRYWWSYWHKFTLADRAFERWADPPVIVYHPADDGIDDEGNLIDLGDEALAVAEQLRSGANVSFPSMVVRGYADDRPTSVREWTAEQMETKSNFEALNQTFEYLDVQKLRSVMVPEQALVEGKGGSSSRNVAETFGDIFQAAQSVVMQEIDDHINRYMIPQLLEANFGPGGATCEKITTGFDPQDLDTMRTIITAVANKEGVFDLPVDMRELLERLGLPLLSHAASERDFEQRLERMEKIQPILAPPAPEPTAPTTGTAGVNAEGKYYRGQERIDLSGWIIERVDELPLDDNPPAVYDPENRTLYVRKDADADEIKKYVFKMAEEREEPAPETSDVQLLLEHVLKLSEKPVVSERPKKVQKTLKRDNQGNVESMIEEIIEE